MFDLDYAFKILETLTPSKVVLQFQDELLSESFSVYNIMQQQFRSKGIEFYINADSTWGSSADDISAKHIDGQIILFFGRDINISHEAVYFIPYFLPLSFCDVLLLIRSHDMGNFQNTFIFYEASYTWLVMKLQFSLDNCRMMRTQVNQSRPMKSTISASNDEVIGGFYIDSAVMDTNSCFLYIGNNFSQLTSIAGRFPMHSLFQLNPLEMSIREIPVRNKLLAEKYGRISKVENAEVIGIIIHSMSMNAEATRNLIGKVEAMIKRAEKQFYTFVIGRIDESKLENFPEIDLFCLISADSIEILKDKSKWRRPIVTPFELQIGLGQREWNSLIKADFDLENTAENVEESDSIDHDIINLSLIQANQRMLAVIEGKGSSYFLERSYQGLQPSATNGNMDIVPGQFGIATNYVHSTK